MAPQDLIEPVGLKSHSYLTPALERWRRATDLVLVSIAVGTLPLLILELVREELVRADRLMLDTVGAIVLVAFTVDFLVELTLVHDRRSYVRSEWLGLIVILSQGLAILPALSAAGVLRVLRAGRLVALVGALTSHRATLREHAGGLALGTAGLVWVSAAVAFTMVEDVGADGRVQSFFDALWWSTTTITTVGYGDVFPVTAAGRIVGGLTMVVGISTFAIVTAKVAEVLVRGDSESSR